MNHRTKCYIFDIIKPELAPFNMRQLCFSY